MRGPAQQTPPEPPDVPPHTPPGVPLPLPPAHWRDDAPHAEGFRDRLLSRLLDHRIVLVHGPLDQERATELAAALLTLDAESGEPVTVRLDSPGGDLGAGLMLADTIDVMRAPVLVDCVGRVDGAAVAVVTAGRRRQASPHARFHLVEPWVDPGQSSGTADEIVRLAARHESMVQQLAERVAAVTGHDAGSIQEQLRSPGTMLSAQAAVAYGLVERIHVPLRSRS
jgi:ATP-dependent Clp protease protease subunit